MFRNLLFLNTILFFLQPLFFPVKTDTIQQSGQTIANQARLLKDNQLNKRDDQLFKSAQTYIKLNRPQHAILLLEDLLKRHPNQLSYYEWLLKAYLQLSRFELADSLIDEMQHRVPENPRFKIDKAEVLFQSNEKGKALQIWEETLENNSNNLNVFNQVANKMIQNRLIDEAIEVYKKAVIQFPKIHNFYYNIANLYKSRLMYNEATEYYLKFLSKQPNQRSSVFNQILSFNIEADQRKEFFRILETKNKELGQNIEIKLLLAQLYQRYKEYDRALNIYLQLEDNKSKGSLLLQFAKSSERDSSYQIALKAYQEIIEKYPKSSYSIQAYKGAVSTLFNLAKQTSLQHFASRGISLVDSLQSLYPNHSELHNLLYSKGEFYIDFYFDIDKAIEIFTTILHIKNLNIQIRNQTYLKLGECYLLKGQLELALKTFQTVKHPKYLGEANLLIGKTYFYMNEWDKSKEILESIIKSEGVSSTITNDAIELQMKLNVANNSSEILTQLAEADFLVVQRKKSEAIKKFINLSESTSITALLKSDIYLELIQLSIDLEEYTQALKYCSIAINDSALVQYIDNHLFLMAGILENPLNRYQEAFSTYQKLLQIYPNSYFAEPARDRMKLIREQKIIEIP